MTNIESRDWFMDNIQKSKIYGDKFQAYNNAVSALDKTIPISIIQPNKAIQCPICKRQVKRSFNYCPKCGQALEYDETKIKDTHETYSQMTMVFRVTDFNGYTDQSGLAPAT